MPCYTTGIVSRHRLAELLTKKKKDAESIAAFKGIDMWCMHRETLRDSRALNRQIKTPV